MKGQFGALTVKLQLDAPQAHDYGMLLIIERDEIEKGKIYLKLAEEGGYR
jgi:hypothetical protein